MSSPRCPTTDAILVYEENSMNRASGRSLRSMGLILLFVAALVGAGTASAAMTARLLYIDGADVADVEIDVTRSIVESDLISHPDVHLLGDRDPEDADMDVTGQLSRLGESYLLILTARFHDGEQRSRRQKIASFDEIDVASRRLVAALVENVEIFETVERGSVLDVEQEPEEVVASDLGFEVGFGTAWPISAALDDHGTMYGFHGAIVGDIRDVLVDLRADFQFGNDDVDTFAFSTTIGGRYVWHSARRYGLYSGAEVGFGYVWSREPGNNPQESAFLVGINSGVELLRHADISLDLRARLQMLTQEIDGDLPVLFGLSLGLRF